MTGLRDRIIAALREAIARQPAPAGYYERIADVLLSLPGIVIVELDVLQGEMRAAVESAIALVAAAGAAGD
jgi:hypothetical protein